jgi:hypothetical protein
MNQIEYFILPRRYKRTWALPRFCLLIAPWKRSHLTGMGMEVICTVQNGVCFEIRKKVGEEGFVHVSRRLLLSPVLRSDRHGDSVPDGTTIQDRLPPTSFLHFPLSPRDFSLQKILRPHRQRASSVSRPPPLRAPCSGRRGLSPTHPLRRSAGLRTRRCTMTLVSRQGLLSDR